MKLDTKALIRATVAVMAVAYVICFLFVAVAPEPTTAVLGYVVHADLSAFVRPVGLGSFLAGLVFWTVFVGLCAAGIGWIYNRSVRA